MSFRSISVFLAVIVSTACPGSIWAQTPAPDAGNTPTGTGVVEPCYEPAPVSNVLTYNFVTRFFHDVCRDAKRNNCWPEPFIFADREAVRAPFNRMVEKGWERQNTLGDQDFVAETGQLTLAGQFRVRNILLLSMPQHRTIYVHRSLLPNETAARVDAVQQLAARTVRQGELPDIRETDLPSPGWSAQQIDDVERKYRATIPKPRLPEESGELSGGSK
jgi:hypothetical protein